MTAAFLLAVTLTFTIKAKGKTVGYFSYKLGPNCTIIRGQTDVWDCDQSYTGAQCTVQGFPVYFYDVTGFPPPTCTTPIRRL